jgi:uncharacterized protein (TIGR02145 family)
MKHIMKGSIFLFCKYLLVVNSLMLVLMACEKPEREIIVETGSVQTIGPTSVTVTGNIIDMGEGITSYGHMASTNESYTANNSRSVINNPTNAGPYTSTVTGLAPNANYYVRAYATGSNGTVYGKSKSFTTLIAEPQTGTFTDTRDNYEYSWVKIGNQVWMAENLAYLPSVSPPSSGSNTSAFYYVYDYYGTSVTSAKATDNYATYGVLYNWPAAMNGAGSSSANPSGVGGACPNGWHLPSDAEWTELTDYLGGEGVAGGKLKEVGYAHWYSPNEGATNESGFTALPGGYRSSNGTFGSIESYGRWWSAAEYDAAYAWGRDMGFGGANVYRGDVNKGIGFSVRCVRDD